MKSTLVSTAAAALLVSNVVAFPSYMDKLMDPITVAALKKRQIDAAAPQGVGALPLTPPAFNATAQYVSNTGTYEFVAPSSTDARGECPGLNAMANHGYLPHNGIATISQLVDATEQVFGMATDLGGFLAIYGAVVDGDLTGWSIDGGPHVGIGGSHNNYETDSSPLKGDLDQYGDNGKLILSQFDTLYAMQTDAATANYNLEVLRTFRGLRYAESIAQNPDFAYLPFSGILVSQAAFTFIYRFMANKSAEYPEGILNKAVLKSFMSITGPETDLVWTRGYERIPDNWYKRNAADEYSVEYFLSDILYFAETQPEILVVGCNQGKVDTFDTISASTLSGGAYTAAELAANPVCFATEFALAELPGLTGLSTADLEPLTAILTTTTSNLGCTAITSINTTALEACPGFSFYGGPTAAVAAGSIQD